MDVKQKSTTLDYKVSTNGMGTMGTRKLGDGDTMNVGPTYIVTVPEEYDQQQMEDLLDLAMAAPDEAIGTALVVRDGVNFTKIDDGIPLHHGGCGCHDDEGKD